LILCDAGPLVALVHASDAHHVPCREAFRSFTEPLVSVWPAFTEAMYLLGFSWQAQEALWAFVERGALGFLSLGIEDAPRMRELMRQYRDLPMDLADAALVRVAEREGLARIFTVDRRDFSVYRPRGLDRFELLPEA
jgi:predicted nucleic acid-binding protein